MPATMTPKKRRYGVTGLGGPLYLIHPKGPSVVTVADVRRATRKNVGFTAGDATNNNVNCQQREREDVKGERTLHDDNTYLLIVVREEGVLVPMLVTFLRFLTRRNCCNSIQ